MKKKSITKVNTDKSKRTVSKRSETYHAVLKDAIQQNVSIDLIDESPFNRRTFYNQKSLEEMADGIKVHGILHDIAVRPKEDGRYELMFGHRRLRAARIAGLKTLPAKVAPATDEQAKEIIFSENIHRENPHPMDEANSIMDMMETGKSVEEIAFRLGKSIAFVYSRMKLVDLIEPMQEVFLNNKISIQNAIEIAALSKESQQELFEDCFSNWKDKNFQLYDLDRSISNYLYDLNKAPFDTKDKDLLPDIGCCSKCPFNSATLKSLFPELSKQAICTNKGCYKQKCETHKRILIEQALIETKPGALLFYGHPSETELKAIEAIPGANDLPRYNVHEMGITMPPELPDKEDYLYENEEGEGEPVFAEEEYNDAMTEYLFEQEQFNDEWQSTESSKGLLIGGNKTIRVIFFPKSHAQHGGSTGQRLTAKAVQEAIKAGTATPGLLQSEMERITSREERAKELDKEKVQLKVHEAFEREFSEVANNKLTEADLLGARLIIYQALDYSTRNLVDKVLFGEKSGYEARKDLLQKLAKLTDQQFAFLIRMVMAGKSDSKLPNNDTAKCLYKMAEAGGIDVRSIEKEQETKAKERGKKQKEKIKELQKKIERMKLAA